MSHRTKSSSTSSSRYCPAKSSRTAAVKTSRPITVQYRKPRPYPCLFSSNISALFAVRNGNSLFFKATRLFEAWIIFIFLRVLLFVELMFAPCKHVYFNSDNKAWWFCLCCGEQLWWRMFGEEERPSSEVVFRGKRCFQRNAGSERTHKEALNLLTRP